MPSSNPQPTSTADSTASISSPPIPRPHHASLLRRLSLSIPEQAGALLERLLAPNTVLYTMAHNNPRSPYKLTPSPIVKDELWRNLLSKRENKKAEVMEIELCQIVEEGKTGLDVEFGVPLCREAEVERWKVDGGSQNGRVGLSIEQGGLGVMTKI